MLKMAIVLLVFIFFPACGKESKNVKMINNPEGRISMEDSVIKKSDAEWKKELTDEQYVILRLKGTEKPFSGRLLHNREKGTYNCSACGSPLFSSENKFDSGCGWPSFDEEMAGGKIVKKTDTSHGMTRTEILCARCGGHLGHLFDDGPEPTGKRYCVNSVSLSFVPAMPADVSTDMITLGGGCFWCVEAVYEKLNGVIKVESGFSGGTVRNPSYEDVCTGTTGHAEVVNITFDKNKTSLRDILKVFFTVHDPTTLNRQGADVGTQYRSVIFYRNEEQKKVAEDIIGNLRQEHVFVAPVVTEVKPFREFFKAEEYHQNYYENNKSKPYCQMVVKPKMEKFEKAFRDLLKK